MTVSHDAHSLPRLKQLRLNRRTGELAYLGDAEERGVIGNMLPVMVAAASDQRLSTIVCLKGQSGDPYSCELVVS